jgi:hypothetical protein
MKNQTDVFAYMMAAEKMTTLVSMMEITLNFMDEYDLKPDDEVSKIMTPLLKRFDSWVNWNKSKSPSP